MIRRVLFVLMLAAPGAVRAAPARAQSPGVPAAINRRVAELVADRWHVPAADVRLTWPDTDTDTDAALRTTDAAAVTLVAERGGWFTVMLPETRGAGVVRRPVRAGVAMPTFVARCALDRDAIVTAADVVDTTVIHWGQPAHTMPGRIGWVTRRAIDAGEPLRPPAVEPPPVIAAGDSVRFVWQRGRIRLVVLGIAAGRARDAGDHIHVRLTDGRTLTGVATGPHLVHAILK